MALESAMLGLPVMFVCRTASNGRRRPLIGSMTRGSKRSCCRQALFVSAPRLNRRHHAPPVGRLQAGSWTTALTGYWESEGTSEGNFQVGEDFWEDVVFDEDGNPAGHRIWDGRAEDGTECFVVQAGEFRALWLGYTLQSVAWAPGPSYAPDCTMPAFGYIRAMAAAALVGGSLRPAGEQVDWARASVAVLGVGGGALPMFLSTEFPGMAVTAVELEGIVIKAAAASMGLDVTSGSSNVVVMDASVWAQEQALANAESMDCVLLDCYDGSGCIPCALRGRGFIQSIWRVLSPNGTLVVNLYDGFEDSPCCEQAEAPFLAVVQERFPHICFVRSPDQPQNTVMLACKSVNTSTLKQDAARAGKKMDLGFPTALLSWYTMDDLVREAE